MNIERIVVMSIYFIICYLVVYTVPCCSNLVEYDDDVYKIRVSRHTDWEVIQELDEDLYFPTYDSYVCDIIDGTIHIPMKENKYPTHSHCHTNRRLIFIFLYITVLALSIALYG